MPVSSSAQLVLLPWLLDWDPLADRTAFAAGLHAGSCAGLTWVLRPSPRTTLRLVATAVPAAVAGVAAADVVESRLGRPAQLAPLLAGAGVLLWWADRSGVSGRLSPTVRAAAAVAQVAALVPGVSRSGATLTALRLHQVPREEALQESLLMSLPVTAGAAGLALWRGRGAAADLAGPLAVGIPVAALTSAVAARVVMGRPRAVTTGAAIYRLGLAAVVAARLLSRKGAA